MPSQQDLEGRKHVCSAAVTRRSSVWRGLRSGQAPRPAITVIKSKDRVPEALQCGVLHRAASTCGSTTFSYGSSSGGMLLAKEALVMQHQPCRSVDTCLVPVCALSPVGHCGGGCLRACGASESLASRKDSTCVVKSSSQRMWYQTTQRSCCYMLQAFQQQATAEQPPAQHQQHAPIVQHSGSTQVLPQLWGVLAKKHGDQMAVHDPHQRPETRLTYRQGLGCRDPSVC